MNFVARHLLLVHLVAALGCAQRVSAKDSCSLHCLCWVQGAQALKNVEALLASNEIDTAEGGNDLATFHLFVRGSINQLIQARDLLRIYMEKNDLKILWPADHLQSENWTEESRRRALSETPECWIKVATTQEVRFTEELCADLKKSKVESTVLFGSNIVWIMVHPKDHLLASSILRSKNSQQITLLPF